MVLFKQIKNWIKELPLLIKLQQCCLVSVEDILKNVPSVEKLSPLPCNEGFLVIWQWADEDISGMFD